MLILFERFFEKSIFEICLRKNRLAWGGPAPAGGGGSRGDSHRAERASTRAHLATQLPTLIPEIISESEDAWLVRFAIRT